MSDTFLSEKVRTARKSHECCLCFLTIPIGAKYSNQKGIFDGGFYVSHSHVECEKKWRELKDKFDVDNDEFLTLDEFDDGREGDEDYIYSDDEFRFKDHVNMIKQKYNLDNV